MKLDSMDARGIRNHAGRTCLALFTEVPGGGKSSLICALALFTHTYSKQLCVCLCVRYTYCCVTEPRKASVYNDHIQCPDVSFPPYVCH